LARLGRTDAWSAVRSLLSIVGWYVLATLAMGVATGTLGLPRSGPANELAVLLGVAAAFGLGVRSAVVFCQKRPFGSLLGPDLRLRPGRVALGAAVWLPGFLAGLAVGAALDALSPAPAHPGPLVLASAAAPHPAAGAAVLLLAGALAFPLQSGAEELVFRGWLTQTLGQVVRPRPQLAALVGVVFAAAHLPHNGVAFLTLVILSLSFSLLSLQDGRLELAMGAHAAHNLALAAAMVLLDGSGHLILPQHDLGWPAVAVAVTQGGVAGLLARWLVRPTAALPRLDAPG
jgi:membrane protease YdiL (CAAX protease family)